MLAINFGLIGVFKAHIYKPNYIYLNTIMSHFLVLNL